MVDTDDTRRTIHDGRRTTPGVWHKLPTGELKIRCFATVPIKMEIKKTYALSNCTFVGIMNIQTIQKNNSE